MSEESIPIDYDVIVDAINKVPDTWVPGLMIVAAERGYRSRCFVPGGASRLIRNMEEKFGFDKERGDAGDVA